MYLTNYLKILAIMPMLTSHINEEWAISKRMWANRLCATLTSKAAAHESPRKPGPPAAVNPAHPASIIPETFEEGQIPLPEPERENALVSRQVTLGPVATGALPYNACPTRI